MTLIWLELDKMTDILLQKPLVLPLIDFEALYRLSQALDHSTAALFYEYLHSRIVGYAQDAAQDFWRKFDLFAAQYDGNDTSASEDLQQWCVTSLEKSLEDLHIWTNCATQFVTALNRSSISICFLSDD